ncbi:MAG: anhydro-N-acetylmuramic acid kinase [Spirochaetaceae bacterium]|nr:anhydro-N-acetylmuramic acid kinase [Spirochaetaceae bacterium]
MGDIDRFPSGSYLGIGLMSGTSVDGIDAALIEAELLGPGDIRIQLRSGLVLPMPERERSEIFALFEDGAGSLERLALLDLRLGKLFARAALAVAESAGVRPSEVFAIGSHGQTIRHVAGEPLSARRGTLQIGSGAAIAQATGIPTASDFRVADIAAGGTGAPLVPFFDRLAASAFEKPVVFQNFGGIGNLCYVDDAPPCAAAGAAADAAADADTLLAFDTGPGNMIVDALAALASGGKLRYDRDGELGSRGRVRPELLADWLGHPFLSARPPKSAGREDFGVSFFRERIEPALLRAGGERAEREAFVLDLIRSAEAFTAATAARAYADFLPRAPKTVIVTGGGARNPLVMGDLAAALPRSRVVSGDEVGLSVDFAEAEAFALMGIYCRLGLRNTEPRATGASRAVVAGKLSLP